MNFYLGCAIWSYKDWVGNLYPPKSQPRDFLNLYSRRFTTVEGNTTFYAVPTVETLAKWKSQTPPGFKFCPKLHRQITHQGLLVPHLNEALGFFERMSGLNDRLGTIFIQLPPSYSPEYFSDLTHFLKTCSQSGFSLAIEVRHQDWFLARYSDRLNSLLDQLKIARVLLDTRPIYNCPDNPQVDSPRQKPQLPLQSVVTSDVALIRFISHPNQKYNQDYLRQWVKYLHAWFHQGISVYFFVHCPQEVRSPMIAKYFYSLLQKADLDLALPPLPWNSISPYPQQLNLF